MEDLFQILFIVIFIVSSIVSSMKKKKKKQQAANKRTQMPTANKQTQKPAVMKPAAAKMKQKTSSEILEEILGLKIQLPEPPQKEAPKSYSEPHSYEEHSWDPAKDYDDINEDKSEDYHDRINAKKSQLEKDKDKHKAFKDTLVLPKQTAKPTKFQKLFENQSNLKDYIVIQELLNKPKALRR